MPTAVDDPRRLVAGIEPMDEVEARHRADTLAWLAHTSDVYRRQTGPVEPARHLVSYFAVVDRDRGSVLLGDHRTSGLWLPSGGHVEPGECPVDAVRRECQEELGIAAVFLDPPGERPLFITVTDTVGGSDVHTDVSLWFCLAAPPDRVVHADPAEYRQVRWWTRDDIRSVDAASFDPHLSRFLDKLETLGGPLG